MRLFEQVGTVTLERSGLYFRFYAVIRPVSRGFCRLYYHTGGGSVRMGLFGKCGEEFSCVGSISARQLGLAEDGMFSVTEVPWRPLSVPLDGGVTVPGALCCRKGEKKWIVLPDGPELLPEILPFFCFLAPERIEGLPCLTMWVDGQGRPVAPDISL